jgi:hypothetical protein
VSALAFNVWSAPNNGDAVRIGLYTSRQADGGDNPDRFADFRVVRDSLRAEKKAQRHAEPPPNGQAKDEAPKPASRVTGAGTFMRSYEAISYTIDGVLPSGCLYGLTAKPGTGKT